MSMTIKTIKGVPGILEPSSIDVDKYEDGEIILKQDDDWIALDKRMVQELGQFLNNLDLD